ncbi:3314_t:CDS:2 [Ambispora gerdemannii]|uniref:3314_t:CDS:1 n=1 Tax=Ambispora gerdemannii TaxID=144530 RepID=A0A9N9BDY9_9GLOM|nr:3314_t:CDS:2 [Ambispora gerdemannii]
MDEYENSTSLVEYNVVEAFQFINGRRYQNSNEPIYMLPIDNIEAERLRKVHCLMRLIFKGNFSSPIEEALKSGGVKVLDIGCGSGAWIMDLSTENSSSTFVGIDMVPIFPKKCPTNAAFLQCNVLDGIPFPDATFDFVHQRSLRLAFTLENWKATIDDILRVTKPGGWVEFCELDLCIRNMGPTLRKILNGATQYHAGVGVEPYVVPFLKHILAKTDKLKEIYFVETSTPFGSWGGKLGEMTFDLMVEEIQGMNPFITPILEVTNEKFSKMIGELETESNDYETSFRYIRWFGQKKEY